LRDAELEGRIASPAPGASVAIEGARMRGACADRTPATRTDVVEDERSGSHRAIGRACGSDAEECYPTDQNATHHSMKDDDQREVPNFETQERQRRRDLRRALTFGIVMATIQMGVLLYLMYC
jgi:hypothetical protein